MNNTNSRALVVSLIGRPNVGKSSIFNRLLSKGNKAITFDMPGVTRDRHYDLFTLNELGEEKSVDCILVDTGGFYPEMAKNNESKDQLSYQEKANHFFKAMVVQGEEAIRESDLVLLVVDIREGLMPYDEIIVRYLREQKKNFWLVANKYDHENLEANIYDFYKLGIGEEQICKVSAAHGLGLQLLKEGLHREALAFSKELEKSNVLEKGITPRERIVGRVAIIGLPNAGKSTLLNALVGSPRALVSNIPGTTVDPIEAYFDLFFGEKASRLDEQEQNFSTTLLFKEYESFRKNNTEVFNEMANAYAETKEYADEVQFSEDVVLNSVETESELSIADESFGVKKRPGKEQLYKNLFQNEDEANTEEERKEEKKDEGSYWRSVHIVDTAGIRQKSHIKEEIEAKSVFRALRCISESDIVIHLVDAMNGISHQDRRLISIALEKGKSVILGLNKFDLLQKKFKDNKARDEYLSIMTDSIPWLHYCDVVPLTAKSNRGLGRLKQALVRTFLIRRIKIPTGVLNRAVYEMVDKTAAHMPGKSLLKVKYCAMVKADPPTVLLFVNKSKGIPDNYKKYLKNELREAFNIRNTPIHLVFRSGADLERRAKEIRPSR